MMRYFMSICLALFLAASAGLTASRALAQSKDDRASDHKKYVVRILSIENGDTTVTDHAVDPTGEKVSWIDDDGNEITAIIGEDDDDNADMQEDMTVEVLRMDKDRAGMLRSDTGGAPMKIIIKKSRAGSRAGMGCRPGGSCCKMGRMEMKEMHGKMDREDMMRMHGKMEKKMIWKEKKDRDDDEDEDSDKGKDKDDDDDGGNLP
ncbi:MAG TPA: hypothetical protein VJO14_03960 [Bacteroidota bacterium]|nr:hypothetical protein [Bacteroidota bacterium]